MMMMQGLQAVLVLLAWGVFGAPRCAQESLYRSLVLEEAGAVHIAQSIVGIRSWVHLTGPSGASIAACFETPNPSDYGSEPDSTLRIERRETGVEVFAPLGSPFGPADCVHIYRLVCDERFRCTCKLVEGGGGLDWVEFEPILDY